MCNKRFWARLILLVLICFVCLFVFGCSGENYSDIPGDYYVRCDNCNNTLEFTYAYDSDEGTFFYCYSGYGHTEAGTDCPVCAYNYGGYCMYDMIESNLSRDVVDSAVVFDPSDVYNLLYDKYGCEFADEIFDELYGASAISLNEFYDSNNYKFIQ